MFDFLAAIGLFFAIEGILFAAFPLGTKRAMAAALDMPECVRKGGRTLGIFATAAPIPAVSSGLRTAVPHSM